MKLKQIISLIESLNIHEVKQLISYLNEDIDISQYPPRIQKLIEEKNVDEIAELIENGEIEETKDILMIQNNYGDSVAHWLANSSYETNWSTNDKDILMLTNNANWSVAYVLACNSYKTNWYTNDKEILKLQKENGWSVAHELAHHSNITKWSTKDKDVLMLKEREDGNSVAYELATFHPTWTTNDPDILNLENIRGETVEDMLIRKRKKFKKSKNK